MLAEQCFLFLSLALFIKVSYIWRFPSPTERFICVHTVCYLTSCQDEEQWQNTARAHFFTWFSFKLQYMMHSNAQRSEVPLLYMIYRYRKFLSVQSLSDWEVTVDWCGLSACCCWQNNSVSPSDSLRAASEKHRGSSDYGLDSKKRKVDDKDSMSRYVSVFVYCFFSYYSILLLTMLKKYEPPWYKLSISKPKYNRKTY